MYSSQAISRTLLLLSLLGCLNVTSNAASEDSENTKANSSGQTYVVQPGDIFGKVCQKYQPEGVSLKAVMAAFYKLNKTAFKNGDETKLIVGSTLVVPSAQALGVSNEAKNQSKLSDEGSTTSVKSDPEAKENNASESTNAIKNVTQSATSVTPGTATENDQAIPEKNTPQAPVIKLNETASTSTWPKNIGIILVVIFTIGFYLRKRKKLVEERSREIKRLLG